MSRPILVLVALLVAIVLALFLLAGRASDRPLTRVEQNVSLENLA